MAFSKYRLGLTLVETLIVLGIIATLISLLAIGVQSARESARKLSCQNNLHQVGIAVTNFVGTNQVFPSLVGNRSAKGDEAFVQTAFVALLPELGAAPYSEARQSVIEPRSDLPPSVLSCPSSSEMLGYRFSFGSGLGTRTQLDGLLRIIEGLSPSEVTDGLSNTVLISERISGMGEISGIGQEPAAAITVLPFYLDADAFVSDCENQTNPFNFVETPGKNWRGHQPVDVGYNHFRSPNSQGWDCQGGTNLQLLSARSYHPGGVFTLYADGSVRWAADSIDVDVWRSLGTAAGNDRF